MEKGYSRSIFDEIAGPSVLSALRAQDSQYQAARNQIHQQAMRAYQNAFNPQDMASVMNCSRLMQGRDGSLYQVLGGSTARMPVREPNPDRVAAIKELEESGIDVSEMSVYV